MRKDLSEIAGWVYQPKKTWEKDAIIRNGIFSFSAVQPQLWLAQRSSRYSYFVGSYYTIERRMFILFSSEKMCLFFASLKRQQVCALQPITSRWQDSNLWPSVPKTDALTRLRYTSSHPPKHIDPPDRWTLEPELAHPFGHRDARTNPSNQPPFSF